MVLAKTKTLILSRPYVAGIFWVACAHLLPRGILDYQGTSLTNESWSDKGCLLSLKFDWSWIDETGNYFVASHRVQTTLLHLDLFVLCLSIVRNGHLSTASRTEMLLRFRMKLSRSITTKITKGVPSIELCVIIFSKKRHLRAEKWPCHQKIGMTISVLRSVGPRRTNTVSLFPATKISSTARKSGIDSFGAQDLWVLGCIGTVLIPVSVRSLLRAVLMSY